MTAANPAPGATWPIAIAGLRRELRVVEIRPGLRIAIFNILGDTDLVGAASTELARRLAPCAAAALVVPEAKAIPLAFALACELDLPYIVLRKTRKPWMGNTLSAETRSITTGLPQTLYLDESDRDRVAGQRIVLLDDVISTGSTLAGMRELMATAGAQVVAEAAILTEGEREQWRDIIALGHLPVWQD